MTIATRTRVPFVDFIPLDVTDSATFDWWCRQPTHDTRTLEEFAADGGYPAFPPNRDEAPTGNRGTR